MRRLVKNCALFSTLVVWVWLHAAPAGDWTEDVHHGFSDGQVQDVVVSPEHDGLVLAWFGENLLTDPGFESPPEKCPQMQNPYNPPPNPPPTNGWVHNGLAGKDGAVRLAPAPHSGKQAWELVDTMERGEPALVQRVVFKPEYRGRNFIFTIWARTREGHNDQAIIALKFSSKTHWRSDVMQRIVVGPEWKRYSLTALMPIDADQLGVVIGPSSYQGKGAILVDDAFLSLATYARSGLYTSRTHDLGVDDAIVWRATYRATTQARTRVKLLLRSGKTPHPDASWSAWDIYSRTPPGRFLQYQVLLSSDSPEHTPIIHSVELSYGAHLGFVSGRLMHIRTGAPIPGAMVTLGTAVARTDAKGEYLLGVEAGVVRGTVKALHYLPETLGPLTLREGERVNLNVNLRPDPGWWTFRRNAQRQGYSALSGSLKDFGVVWQYPLGTTGGGHILPADLDGDGTNELVIARGGSVYARRLNGDLIWETHGWEIGSILGVYDLLGNGQKQVIGLSAGWQPYANGAFTVLAGHNGEVLCRVDEWPDAGDIGHGDTKDYLHGGFSPLVASSCVVADLDQDGKLEIVVHPNYHSALMCFDFHDGLTRPHMMWKTMGRFKYDLYLYPLLAADVDGDARLEIVLHDNDLIRIFDGRTGEEKSAADMGCLQGLFGHMACGDVDGDGTAEVLLIPTFKPTYTRNTVALAGWNGNAVVRRWSRDFPEVVKLIRDFAPPFTSPFAPTGDGKTQDIVVQVGNDVLVLRAADGTEKRRVPAASVKRVPQPLGYDKSVIPGGPYMTSPVVADLDGDGKMKVLVRDANGVIQVLDATGSAPQRLKFPELNCDTAGDISRGGGITACDLENDGKAEIIFRQAGHLVVANSDGSIRFKSEMTGLRFPAVGRFDRDNVLDIACYADQRWIAFSGKDGKIIWNSPAPESNEVAVWDVDGDGCDEITGKHGPVFLLNGADGRVLWTAFRKEQCALGLGVFADLDGDGRMEIMAIGEYCNTAWRKNGQPMWWPGWSSGGAKEHYGAVADVNGDGGWDFALSSNHGVLYCLDGRDGRELWRYTIPEKVSLSHCAAADLDGDGRPEFVFGTNTGKLIVVNGEDGSLAKSLDFKYPVGEPVIADINGDGLAEILVVSNSNLYALAGRK